MYRKLWIALILLACVTFWSTGCEDKQEAEPAAAEKAEEPKVKTGPKLVKQPGAKVGDTTMCPIMGGEFTVKDSQVSVEHNGQKVYFCCPGCDEKFKADPEKHLDALNKKIEAENARRTAS